MSIKTMAYVGIVVSALLALALGGWVVKGAKALTGRSRKPDLRPRFA